MLCEAIVVIGLFCINFRIIVILYTFVGIPTRQLQSTCPNINGPFRVPNYWTGQYKLSTALALNPSTSADRVLQLSNQRPEYNGQAQARM
jgi:hypothetical protein